MKKFEYKEEYRHPTNILLNVTDDCNLQCRYCFVEQNPHYMSLQTALDTIEWSYNNRINLEQKISIYFFGGEPTLCFDSIIVPIVNYCKEKYPNIFTFGMTTNGTLLNKERINWLKENKFYILLSIDGDKQTQDFNRPCKNCNLSSFDLLEKNIKDLLLSFPNICFRSTIYPPTVEHLFKNYLYAESLGFKKYEMIEETRHNELWSKEKIQILREQIGKIYAYRLNQILNNQSVMSVGRINKWLEQTIQILDKPETIFIDSNVKRCGLGTTTCSVGWDGNIYGCQEQTSKGEKSFFYIGNIYNNGIDINKHKKLLEFYINEQIKEQKNRKKECINCLLQNICNGNYLICPSTDYDLFEDMNSINNITCEIRKIYIENSILFLSLLSNIKSPEKIKEIFGWKKGDNNNELNRN